MPTVVGTLLIQGEDYLTTVSAVDFDVNGQTLYVTYVNGDGDTKAKSMSIIQNVDGTLPVAISGCSIS